MRTWKLFLIGGLLGGILGLAAPPAIAHSTGHESRTKAECEKLASPERGHCLECVSRPRPHHFHPDYPPGNRCRPDDGQP